MGWFAAHPTGESIPLNHGQRFPKAKHAEGFGQEIAPDSLLPVIGKADQPHHRIALNTQLSKVFIRSVYLGTLET